MLALVAPTKPRRKQWKMLENHDRIHCMTPEEFLAHWDVTHAELADIVGKTQGHVAHWFTQGKSRKEPSKDDLRRLSEVHHIWMGYETEPSHLREIWSRKRKRRKQ